MSIKLPPREKLEEIYRRIEERRSRASIIAGEDVELVVIDAVERVADVVLAGFSKSWSIAVYSLAKSGIPPELLNKLIGLMQGMKCALVRGKAVGSRILAVTDVEEYAGEIPSELVTHGTVSKTSTGAKVWIDSDKGRLLVSNVSIKGALLAAGTVDGDRVAFVGMIQQGRIGVPIVNYIHWVKVSESASENAPSGINKDDVNKVIEEAEDALPEPDRQ